MEDSPFALPSSAGPGHGMNPMTVLTGLFSLIALAFIAPTAWWSLGLFTGFILPLAMGTRSLRTMTAMIFKFMIPFSIFLFPIHGLVVPGPAPVEVWGILVNPEGLELAGRIFARLLVMIGGCVLLFKMVHPGTLLKELVNRGLPWGPAYVICTTLLLLPRMKKRVQTIGQAQQSRGLNTSGSLMTRARALIPLAGPLLFGTLAEVEQRAVALELKQITAKGKKPKHRTLPDSPPQIWFRRACLAVIAGALGSRLWLG